MDASQWQNSVSNCSSQTRPLHTRNLTELPGKRTNLKRLKLIRCSPRTKLKPKNGILLICAIYRKLNTVINCGPYPIPRINECRDSLGKETIFSMRAVNSGHYQIKIDYAEYDKTAFILFSGLYHFVRMTSGLPNAPGTFHCTVNFILPSNKWKFALVYLKDIVVISKMLQQHMKQVRKVLLLVHSAGVILILKSASSSWIRLTTWATPFVPDACNSLPKRRMSSED